MNSEGSGQKMLRFAVTGALLGGGAVTGCANKGQTVDDVHTNVGPAEYEPEPDGEPEPEPMTKPHTNIGPEAETEPHTNPGPEGEPPPVATNPAPQPEPSK